MIQNRYHLLLDLYMYGAIAVSIKECAAEKDNAPGDESRAACTGLNDTFVGLIEYIASHIIFCFLCDGSSNKEKKMNLNGAFILY